MSKSNGGPAFACAAENGYQEGMTLWDYYAAQALSSFVVTPSCDSGNEVEAVQAACIMADEMIKEREKRFK